MSTETHAEEAEKQRVRQKPPLPWPYSGVSSPQPVLPRS